MGEMMGVYAQNKVRIAVDRVGGPGKAAELLGVHNWTVHYWIRNRRISKIDIARTLAKLSGMQVQELRRTL